MNSSFEHYGSMLGRRWLLGAAVLFFCALGAGPVEAKTPLEQEWSRFGGWSLAWFRLEGVPDELSGDLRSGLALAGKKRLFRGRARPDFGIRLLQEDMARVRLFLAREGYPAAVVVPQAFPEAGAGRLGVVLRIEPGPVVRVVASERRGWPTGLAPPDSTAGAFLRPGERFRDARLAASREDLRRILTDAGYAHAEVEVTVRPIDATSVVVVHAVSPGERFDITGVTVRGCSPDLEDLTRRLMDITPPTRYSRTRLEEAAFDLRSTQLYRQVALEVSPEGPGQLHLSAQVENARMRSVESSVGTWSDNPWMVRAGWSHRNLLGGGKGLDAHAAVAVHNQNAGGGVNWFGWLSPRARTRAGAEWVREDEDAYLSQEWRLDLTQSLRPGRRDLAHVGLSIARVSLTSYSDEDVFSDDLDGDLLEIWADRKWDWTDDPLYPRRGGFGKLVATWSPPIGLSESPYVSVQGDLSLYRRVGDVAVLAGRVRAGWAAPLGDTETVIASRRFYAGGYGTMRGYGRRKLGPRDADGVAVGGDAVLLAGLETRVPMVWILEAVAFMDVGQVWWKPGDARLSDLATAVGVGLDVRSPLGPVRLGVAWNLGAVAAGEPRTLAHFGVGYPW